MELKKVSEKIEGSDNERKDLLNFYHKFQAIRPNLE